MNNMNNFKLNKKSILDNGYAAMAKQSSNLLADFPIKTKVIEQ